MNRRVLIPVLLVVALLSLAYGVYRSTAPRITVMENGHETIYGEPQHGLILGLCIFSGMCIMSVVALMIDRKEEVVSDTAAFNKRYI